MKKVNITIAVFVLLSLLTSCAAFIPPTPENQPVSENNAVVALMNTARTDIANGRLDTAAAPLERALRIEPRNPFLWKELASLRLQQGQYLQAEGLAARSNGWTGSNKTLRAENWRIIGEARLKRGDHPGAQAAFDKAATERN